MAGYCSFSQSLLTYLLNVTTTFSHAYLSNIYWRNDRSSVQPIKSTPQLFGSIAISMHILQYTSVIFNVLQQHVMMSTTAYIQIHKQLEPYPKSIYQLQFSLFQYSLSCTVYSKLLLRHFLCCLICNIQGILRSLL